MPLEIVVSLSTEGLPSGLLSEFPILLMRRWYVGCASRQGCHGAARAEDWNKYRVQGGGENGKPIVNGTFFIWRDIRKIVAPEE